MQTSKTTATAAPAPKKGKLPSAKSMLVAATALSPAVWLTAAHAELDISKVTETIGKASGPIDSVGLAIIGVVTGMIVIGLIIGMLMRKGH